MMEIDNTMDQYEKQLYTLFASYDSAHNGSLGREALEELCITLQLENRGLQLIDLLLNDSKELCVTFPKFRDGLLTVLGSEHSETSVKILDRSDLNSGEDSSGREVSPKYTFGSKKYGRRSKPSRSIDSADYNPEIVLETDNSSMGAFESENNNPSLTSQDKIAGIKKRKNNFKLKRSLSYSGHRNNDSCDKPSDFVLSRTNKHLGLSRSENVDSISVSASLAYQDTIREIDHSENVVEILDCNSNNQINISQPICFQDIMENEDVKGLAGNCLQTIASNEMISAQSQREKETVSLGTVMELWEAAGVAQPHQLLCDLGFSKGDAVLSEIIYVLEEEIQGILNNLQETFSPTALITLFQAALCLYQCEKKSLKMSLNHISAERDKLRTDLSDANQRAVLLAHEVDDNHAKMESAAKNSFKQLEQKHSETVKQLSEQLLSEKEQSASQISNLEKHISVMESEESKFKSQISQLNDENIRIEKDLNNAHEQIYELTEIKKQLSKEIKILNSERQNKTQNSLSKESELTFLESQIKKLHDESIILKDKNDELCAELESVKMIQSTDKLKRMCAENNCEDSINGDRSKHADTPITIAHVFGVNGVKRRGVSPTHIPDLVFQEENPRICKQRKYHKNNLIHIDNNIFKQDTNQCKEDLSSSENNSFNLSLDYDSNQALDVLICIKHLTPENIEDLIKILKTTTNTLSNFFVQSQIKHYYLGLHLLLKKIMDDMKKIIENNKSLEINSIESNLKTLVQNIVTESCSINIEDHQLLHLLTNFDNQYYQSSLDKTVNENESSSDEAFVKNCKSSSDFISQLSHLEFKIKDLTEVLEVERNERKEDKVKDMEKYSELESNMELLKNEYDKCEEYWASKVNEEREIFDQEQRMTDEKFAELLSKLSEYEEQFASQDVKNDSQLSTIEERYNLEKQFTDLEDEFEEYKLKAERELSMKISEIHQLNEQIEQLEKMKVCQPNHDESLGNVETKSSCHNLISTIGSCEKDNSKDNVNHDGSTTIFSNGQQAPESFSAQNLDKISSPIDYLWNQSTIPSPLSNVRTADIARDYHNPAFFKDQFSEHNSNFFMELPAVNVSSSIMPIQKPISSVIKTPQSLQKNQNSHVNEKKMLFCSELEEELQGRRREVQQLEATRARLDADVRALSIQLSNPQNQVGAATLKAVALENYCRQLQTALRQQHSYAEAVMQQNIAAHRGEVGALRQRLAAADLLVRDLYVENCHLARSLTTSVTK